MSISFKTDTKSLNVPVDDDFTKNDNYWHTVRNSTVTASSGGGNEGLKYFELDVLDMMGKYGVSKFQLIGSVFTRNNGQPDASGYHKVQLLDGTTTWNLCSASCGVSSGSTSIAFASGDFFIEKISSTDVEITTNFSATNSYNSGSASVLSSQTITPTSLSDLKLRYAVDGGKWGNYYWSGTTNFTKPIFLYKLPEV